MMGLTDAWVCSLLLGIGACQQPSCARFSLCSIVRCLSLLPMFEKQTRAKQTVLPINLCAMMRGCKDVCVRIRSVRARGFVIEGKKHAYCAKPHGLDFVSQTCIENVWESYCI